MGTRREEKKGKTKETWRRIVEKERAWDGRAERWQQRQLQTDNSGRKCVLPYAPLGVKRIGRYCN